MTPGMPAIDSMMKRLGFVRLRRYGMVLTPEGRIITLRPAVLDDGTGGRIVGWRDDDLAAMELATWSPQPAAARAVATPVASASAPRVAISLPAGFDFPRPSPVVEVMTIPVAPPPAVASAPQVEEDDWEWEIALARARAAAEESEAATRPPSRTTRPMLATKIESDGQSPAPGCSIESWPRTEPLGTIDYEDYSSATREMVRVARGTEPPPLPSTQATKVIRVPTPVAVKPRAPVTISQPAITARPIVTPRAGSPTTIIPVPKLATVASSQTLTPVVRSAAPLPSVSRRLANGTGPAATKATSSPSALAPIVPLAPKPPVIAASAAPAGRSKLPSIVQRAR